MTDQHPTLYTTDGVIPMTLFSNVVVLDNGTTEMTYIGTEPMPVTRIVQASGDDLPVIPGAQLMPGAFVSIPHRGFGKIKGTGHLHRNGKVVYDDPVQRAEAKARGENVWEPPEGWQVKIHD